MKADQSIFNINRRFSFAQHKNIVINPELKPILFKEKRHPVYIQENSEKEEDFSNLKRSNSVNINTINRKNSIVIK
jgi:hypothetical protein